MTWCLCDHDRNWLLDELGQLFTEMRRAVADLTPAERADPALGDRLLSSISERLTKALQETFACPRERIPEVARELIEEALAEGEALDLLDAPAAGNA